MFTIYLISVIAVVILSHLYNKEDWELMKTDFSLALIPFVNSLWAVALLFLLLDDALDQWAWKRKRK